MAGSNRRRIKPADRLEGFDFVAHNAEVRAMWAAFHSGRPTRVPIILGINPRFWLLDPDLNDRGFDFRSYSEDPEVMLDAQLEFQRYSRFNLLQDAELGLPEKWTVYPDFQNYYEAAWFGCPVIYPAGEVPDTTPAFAERPEELLDRGMPEPAGGLMARVIEFYQKLESLAQDRMFAGRQIKVAPGSGLGTDGPFTIACSLFSAEFVCTAIVDEPERLARLLGFITEATINRMTVLRRRFGVPVPQENFGFADDSVALIGVEQYREHVLPHHRRLCDAMSSGGSRSIHLCGDATRHFKTLRDELDVRSFDTGFPVDFAKLRRELGDVIIQGGPHVRFLLSATPEEVRDRVREILNCGVLDGGRFILREGNNLAPLTPPANTEAMYRAGREFGVLRSDE